MINQKITVIGHHTIYDAMLERARDDLGWPETPHVYVNIDDEIADFDCMYESMLDMQDRMTDPIVCFESDDTSCPNIKLDTDSVNWIKNNKDRLIKKWTAKAEQWGAKSYRFAHYGDYCEAEEASDLHREFTERCTAIEKAIAWIDTIA